MKLEQGLSRCFVAMRAICGRGRGGYKGSILGIVVWSGVGCGVWGVGWVMCCSLCCTWWEGCLLFVVAIIPHAHTHHHTHTHFTSHAPSSTSPTHHTLTHHHPHQYPLFPSHSVVRFKTLQEEGSGSYAAETLKRLLMSEESAVSAAMYVLLRAADKYKQEHKRFPGSENEEYEGMGGCVFGRGDGKMCICVCTYVGGGVCV